MIVGVGSRFPPMYDFTGPSPVGFDPDLIQGVATCLGKRGPVDFRGGGRVLDRAASGEVDVSIGALSIRPERERTVRFSAPYLFASLIVVGRTERAEELSGDLSGRTCVAGPSPVYTEVLASVACVRKSSSTTDDALAQVARGDADFAVVDSALGAMLPAGVQRTGRRLGEDRYGIAMARSNAGLKAAVDACLKQLDGDGFIEELRQRYDL
jgi:ABC-type amino acid transport substrate-binding protein